MFKIPSRSKTDKYGLNEKNYLVTSKKDLIYDICSIIAYIVKIIFISIYSKYKLQKWRQHQETLSKIPFINSD